jgi:protein-L-isoaspartate(D-aspartate) O-methyltransferase
MALPLKRTSFDYSPERLQFAQMVVARSAILDDELSSLLLEVFAVVPRERFYAPEHYDSALLDMPLPVGFNCFSPQPSLHARMLGIIAPRRGMKILVLGGGTGYLPALLAAAGVKVYAVEKKGLLAQAARKRLDALSFQDVLVKCGDLSRGWREHGKFDGIIIERPVAAVEQEILSQLVRPGGRLVAPVGLGATQTVTLMESRDRGITTYQLEECVVPHEVEA